MYAVMYGRMLGGYTCTIVLTVHAINEGTAS